MERFLLQHKELKIDNWLDEFESILKPEIEFFKDPKGNAYTFNEILKKLPDIKPSSLNLDNYKIIIGNESDAEQQVLEQLRKDLHGLDPWRKGPFELFGIEIDTEWQSWLKWDRFKGYLGNVEGKRILDIGSSNGYYMFRLAANDPSMVVGVEPQHSFFYQYLALQKYLNLENVFCLPIRFDQFPLTNNYFDMVFCMGVLYHRKSPVEMLQDIHKTMKNGGDIFVENLVLETKQGLCLFPESRYAKMRNVFFIPDLKCMEFWLERAGFSNIECLDVSKTTIKEQRKTEWIGTESLINFFDPKDHSKTIEGYPAPVRAIFKATA